VTRSSLVLTQVQHFQRTVGFTRCSRCPFAGFYQFCSKHIPSEIEIETLLHSVLSCHSPAISISKILLNHSLASSLMELDGKPHTTLPHAHPTSSSLVLPCCPGPSNMARSPVIACLASSILALGMAILPRGERCGISPPPPLPLHPLTSPSVLT